MHYGKHNEKYVYNIGGAPLEKCKTYKDLGVHILEDLTPAEQIKKCVAKANSMVGMIKRTSSYIDKDISENIQNVCSSNTGILPAGMGSTSSKRHRGT